MNCVIVHSDVPLGRPHWRRTIETDGHRLIIKIFNDGGVEVHRTVATSEQLSPLKHAVRIALAATVDGMTQTGQITRKDGKYFTVAGGSYRGRREVSLALHHVDGSPMGKPSAITEVEALQIAVDALITPRQSPQIEGRE
jgi:hypothetical protein